jgi:hypothetical protein
VQRSFGDSRSTRFVVRESGSDAGCSIVEQLGSLGPALGASAPFVGQTRSSFSRKNAPSLRKAARGSTGALPRCACFTWRCRNMTLRSMSGLVVCAVSLLTLAAGCGASPDSSETTGESSEALGGECVPWAFDDSRFMGALAALGCSTPDLDLVTGRFETTCPTNAIATYTCSDGSTHTSGVAYLISRDCWGQSGYQPKGGGEGGLCNGGRGGDEVPVSYVLPASPDPTCSKNCAPSPVRI